MDDLIVVGAGLSGLLATAYALERGARVRLIAGGIGAPLVAPGWISIADNAPGNVLSGAETIAAESPEHPYALAGIEALRGAIDVLRRTGESIGLPFDGDLTTNLRLPTALGTVQTPALAPRGLAAGDGHGANALIVGFAGWRDFYPRLTGLRTALVQLPGNIRPWDATPTDLARIFDDPAVRAAVAAGVRHNLDGAAAVGFPAVLGLDDPLTAQRDLADRLGVPVFEMPTLPPSTPGVRLFNKLRRHFLDSGVRVQIGHPVVRGIVQDGRTMGVEVAAAGRPSRFMTKAVILATGGLYGGGLFSDDRGGIIEPIFGLPVSADPDREGWFNPQMLAATGHPVHRFGVRVNSAMQPIRADSSPVAEGLYAIGHLLAAPGTTPTANFSEGVALATAFKAIEGALG